MAAFLGRDVFRRIRLSLAATIIMAAVGGIAVFGTGQLLQAEKRENTAASARRAEIQVRLARAREEELEIKNKIARFNELAGRGIFGLEQRLDWIEQIRRIKQERKLLDLQYEIAPQQPIDSTLLPGSSAEFEFLSSPMQLRMLLLHEEDLLNFLADLRAVAPAFLRVRKCNIDRLPRSGGEGRGIAPQLAAECAIDWITVRERKAA